MVTPVVWGVVVKDQTADGVEPRAFVAVTDQW
jgi:hypothetical protein